MVDYQFRSADSLIASFVLKRNARWNGDCTGYFNLSKPHIRKLYLNHGGKLSFGNYKIKERIPINAFMKFMGWWLAEGYTYGNYIYISQSSKSKNGEYRAEIASLIKEMGFTPCEKKTAICFCSAQLATYLKQFGKHEEKYIPKWIKDQPPEKLELLLETLVKGDGSFREGSYLEKTKKSDPNHMVEFSTTSESLAEDFCELLIKTGRAFNIKKTVREGRKNRWRVYIHNKFALEPYVHSHPQEVDYNGKVWCVSVPNERIYAVRNGKGVWVGNSPYIGEPKLLGWTGDKVGKMRGVPPDVPIWQRPNVELLKKAYEGNLRLVLSEVRRLLENIGDRFNNIVVTSDHGEALGEDGIFAHSKDHPVVRKIPWLEVK